MTHFIIQAKRGDFNPSYHDLIVYDIMSKIESEPNAFADLEAMIRIAKIKLSESKNSSPQTLTESS